MSTKSQKYVLTNCFSPSSSASHRFVPKPFLCFPPAVRATAVLPWTLFVSPIRILPDADGGPPVLVVLWSEPLEYLVHVRHQMQFYGLHSIVFDWKANHQQVLGYQRSWAYSRQRCHRCRRLSLRIRCQDVVGPAVNVCLYSTIKLSSKCLKKFTSWRRRCWSSSSSSSSCRCALLFKWRLPAPWKRLCPGWFMIPQFHRKTSYLHSLLK